MVRMVLHADVEERDAASRYYLKLWDHATHHRQAYFVLEVALGQEQVVQVPNERVMSAF